MKTARQRRRWAQLGTVLLLGTLLLAPDATAGGQSQSCYTQCVEAQRRCEAEAAGRPFTMGGWCEYSYSSKTCLTEYCIINGWPDPLPGTPIMIGG